MSVRRLCEEEATEEEKAEAAGAELKTKTPHNDVGNNIPEVLGLREFSKEFQNIVFFGFFGFLEVFLVFYFLSPKTSGILFFLFFLVFSRYFWFSTFSAPKPLEDCVFLVSLGFSSFFLIFFDVHS